MTKNPVSVYVNFPFCDGCSFCTTVEYADVESRIDNYVVALVNEIKSSKADGKVVHSVFLGDGAGLVPIKHLNSVMNAIKENFTLSDKCEVTIELSPTSPHITKLGKLQYMGINRISLQAVAIDDVVLGILGKRFTVHRIRKALDNFKNYSFKVNVDLRVGVPIPKNLSDMKLRRSPEVELANLLTAYPQIEHVSLYEVEIEDGTDLARELDYEQSFMQTVEDLVDDIILIHGVMEKFGLKQYDTWHWAKDGAYSIYNRSHLEIENECYAFGANAKGLIRDERYENHEDIDMYILAGEKVDYREKRTTLDKINEALINQLGTPNGVDLAGLRKLGLDILVEKQKQITELKSLKLIKATKNTLKMTKSGALLVNYALGELLFDEEEFKSLASEA